jgi:hypothetical protein
MAAMAVLPGFPKEQADPFVIFSMRAEALQAALIAFENPLSKLASAAVRPSCTAPIFAPWSPSAIQTRLALIPP